MHIAVAKSMFYTQDRKAESRAVWLNYNVVGSNINVPLWEQSRGMNKSCVDLGS